MNNKFFIYLFLFFFINSYSYSLDFKGEFTEGALIKGKANKETKIFIDNQPLKISKTGLFVFGIEKGKKNIVIDVYEKDEKKTLIKKIKKRNFLVQKINNLPKKMVTPGKKELERIKKEQVFFDKMRTVNSDDIFFYSSFIRPAEGIISGRFGSQRILNGKPRRPHLGMDIANKKGTPIKASASGTVTLAKKDLYFTGDTIGIEHGHGITSVYYHLNSINVVEGQKIIQGDIIGTMGSTGRATGDHLHFGIYWIKNPVDPELVLKN